MKTLKELKADEVYDIFRATYGKMGNWTKETFIARADKFNWLFFGDKKGYIAITVNEKSGLARIAAAAGDNRSLEKGLKDALLSIKKPLFGLVTSEVTSVAAHCNMVIPNERVGGKSILTKIIPTIAKIFDKKLTLARDGGILETQDDIGKTRYLVGNKAFFVFLSKVLKDQSPAVKKFLDEIIK